MYLKFLGFHGSEETQINSIFYYFDFYRSRLYHSDLFGFRINKKISVDLLLLLEIKINVILKKDE